MSQTVTGVIKRNPDEIRWIELTPKNPPVQLTEKKEKKEKKEIKTEKAADNLSPSLPPLPKDLFPMPQKELKFFSEPKKVIKKTQGSILSFQIFTSLIFCLIFLLSKAAVPELYENLHIFFTGLFK